MESNGWVVISGPAGSPQGWSAIDGVHVTAEAAIGAAQALYDAAAAALPEEECAPSALTAGDARWAIRWAGCPEVALSWPRRAAALVRIIAEMKCCPAIPEMHGALAVAEGTLGRSSLPAIRDAGMAAEAASKTIEDDYRVAVYQSAMAANIADRMAAGQVRSARGMYREVLEAAEAMAKCLSWTWSTRPSRTQEGELARARMYFQAIRSLDDWGW